MTRTYGHWAGNPKGLPENRNNCVAEVPHGITYGQCCRKRGYGPNELYCKQHAHKLAMGMNVNVPEDKDQ